MPRSLDATLLAAMNSGSYNAIIRAWGVLEGTRKDELSVLYFKLHLEELDIKVTGYDEDNPDIQLERGCSIDGTEYTIYSSIYIVERASYHLGIWTMHCVAITPSSLRLTLAADKTYHDLIDYISDDHTPRYIGTPAWKSYKLLPAGIAVSLNNVRAALPWLRQKYLIFCTDYDGDELLWFSAAEAYNQDASYTILTAENDILDEHYVYRCFVWRDENGTLHTDGSTAYPYHNLGYLESTAAAPDFTGLSTARNRYIGTRIRVGANLKYLTSDTATINGIKVILDVTECFDPKQNPSWHMDLEPLVFLNTTEGGALPASLQDSTPYTALNTSAFDGILSSSDTNLQAAMDTIDDHDHDSDYAAIDHLHTGVYAAASHNHDTSYVNVGGDTMTGSLIMGVNALYGSMPDTLSDDHVVCITPERQYGAMLLIMRSNLSTTDALIAYRVITVGRATIIAGGSSVATYSGILYGTTGTDGKLTVGASSNGNIYIENRLGSSVSFHIIFLGG